MLSFIFTGSSVLLQDDANHAAGGSGGEVVLNMDGESVDKSKYQQQLQLIDEQVGPSGVVIFSPNILDTI